MLAYVVIAIALVIFLPIVYASYQAAPPLSTPRKDIERIIRLARITADDIVYDLGSGSGRLLITLAQATPARAFVGFELSPLHIFLSRLKVRLKGLQKRVTIQATNFYTHDLSEASVIVCFLTPFAMRKLGPKLKQELRPTTRVISYMFEIPGLTLIATDRPAKNDFPLYIYQVGAY